MFHVFDFAVGDRNTDERPSNPSSRGLFFPDERQGHTRHRALVIPQDQHVAMRIALEDVRGVAILILHWHASENGRDPATLDSHRLEVGVFGRHFVREFDDDAQPWGDLLRFSARKSAIRPFVPERVLVVFPGTSHAPEHAEVAKEHSDPLRTFVWAELALK